MSPEYLAAVLSLLCDLRLSVDRLSSENAELRRALELAHGNAPADAEALRLYANDQPA